MPMGSVVEVEIAKLVSFGAFAKLDNGIEGLIHVSELSSDRVQKPEEVLNIGDKVMAKVISVSAGDRKIGLSIREAQRDMDQSLMSEHGESGGGASVDVSAAMQGSMPDSMMQAGRSLADVAHEMMAAVSKAEAARTAEADAEAEAAKEAPAENADSDKAE